MLSRAAYLCTTGLLIQNKLIWSKLYNISTPCEREDPGCLCAWLGAVLAPEVEL